MSWLLMTRPVMEPSRLWLTAGVCSTFCSLYCSLSLCILRTAWMLFSNLSFPSLHKKGSIVYLSLSSLFCFFTKYVFYHFVLLTHCVSQSYVYTLQFFYSIINCLIFRDTCNSLRKIIYVLRCLVFIFKNISVWRYLLAMCAGPFFAGFGSNSSSGFVFVKALWLVLVLYFLYFYFIYH